MNSATWLEVSLILDGEMAEAVSEVLARYLSGGIAIESTSFASDLECQGEFVGPLRVYGYLAIDHELEQRQKSLEEALWHLGQIRPLPEVQYKRIAENDWSSSWKRHFQPICVGHRLIIIPSWMEYESGSRIAVHIDPGMAFGTGTHPTTQLCLEILDEGLRSQSLGSQQTTTSHLTMIDVGCGSGILSIAAIKLGVGCVLGVDNDLEAIDNAYQNALANNVQDSLELGQGSIAEIMAGNFLIKSAPIVMANILAPVLVRMLEAGMSDVVTPGGSLILSGILEEQTREVMDAIDSSCLYAESRYQKEDWVALVAKKPI